MPDPIETLTHADLTIEIHYDDTNSVNPRDWDNVGTMVCWHRSADLGDETIDTTRYMGMDDLIMCALPTHKSNHRLPLYLYSHSGMTMRTTPFGDPWDSGQVGWIVASTQSIEKIMPHATNEQILNALEAEVKEYDSYLRGEVYGYIIKDTATGVELDSCWGYIGDPKAATEDAMAAARNIADDRRTQTDQEHHEALYWAKYGIPTDDKD